MICKIFAILILPIFLLVSHCQQFNENEEMCNKPKKNNCSECIQTPGCKWCKDSIFNLSRCFYDESITLCKEIENPSSSKGNVENGPEISTIQPSKALVKLRLGKSNKINITMEYTDEKNRPLDLYILMDLSCTMLNQKKKVEELASTLAKSLKANLTSDLRMGFGSFVDKPVAPFSSERENTQNYNCKGISLKQRVPHLFKNHLPMTDNITKFTQVVEGAEILTNIDVPEGGLDALMQAIECSKQIGWRFENKTRRLIVVSTDGPYHICGDGKLGGIILPNDGQCHLDNKGEYTHASIFDYPSISQIRDKIVEHNVYVIFAVIKPYLNIYQKLVDAIGPGLSSAQSINNENSSIPEVIKMEYEKVVSKVKFQVPLNDYIQVVYYVQCPGSKDFKMQADCDNLTPGAKVKVKVELELKKCPRILKRISLPIKPFQSTGETNMLNITVEPLCSCNCELPSQVSRSQTEECSRKGRVQCGICKCDDGFGGQFCNCSKAEGQSVDRERCLDKNSRVCSNNGECSCGECVCNEGFGGKFCDCSNDGCPMQSEDQGRCNVDIGNGKCECDRCRCNPGFTGVRCQCPISEVSCKDPNAKGGGVCNGFGTCDCGKCSCSAGYHGEFCGIQHARFAGSCSKDLMLKATSCVTCLSVDNSKTADSIRLENCKSDCADANVVFMDEIDEVGPSECLETVKVESSGCVFGFIVGNRDVITKKINIRTEREANCRRAPILPVILGVIGAILCIGILTLLVWKILTHIHDKKEFQRFENERATASWTLNQNPLYKATVTEFQNPAYSADSTD